MKKLAENWWRISREFRELSTSYAWWGNKNKGSNWLSNDSPPAGIGPVCKNMSPQFDSILCYLDIYRWKKTWVRRFVLVKLWPKFQVNVGDYFSERTTWSLRTQFFFHPWASPKKIMMRDGGDIFLHTGAIPAGRLWGKTETPESQMKWVPGEWWSRPCLLGITMTSDHFPCSTYGLKPKVWGRVGPDPWVELQVDPAQGSGPTLTQTKDFNPIISLFFLT